jgi:small subunit ribosomal protein S16
MGTTKRPVYRLVVADSRSPRDGRFIESIGFYDPLPNPAVVTIDAERVQLWLRRGARPSDSARQLLVKEGILAARPFKITPRAEVAAEPVKPAAKAEAGKDEAAPEAAAEAATEEVPTVEEPAAEAPAAEASAAETAVTEPAVDEPSVEAGAAALDEAGGDAGGSLDAQEARPGGVPAATGPAAADGDEEQ